MQESENCDWQFARDSSTAYVITRMVQQMKKYVPAKMKYRDSSAFMIVTISFVERSRGLDVSCPRGSSVSGAKGRW